jgi:O-antigen ligase/tetratricopeptide (TPR) repeat protein
VDLAGVTGRFDRAGLGRIALGAALIFVLLIGGSEFGRLVTGVRAVATVVGGGLIVSYAYLLPKRHDLVDRLVLLAFLLYVITCVTSVSPRDSVSAATTGLAYVAAFYLARDLTGTSGGERMATTALGLVGVVLSLVFVIVWGQEWIAWLAVPGAGAPPLDLELPGGMFRHQYLAASVIAMTMPAMVLLSIRAGSWPVGVVGTLSGLAVIVMSGGRGLWLAGLAAVVVGVVLSRHMRLPRNTGLRWASIAVLAIALIALWGPLTSRFGTTSTVELRLAIWQDSLNEWTHSPIVGFGPGTFARQFQLSGYNDTYSAVIPHAHNAAVQSLVEGGLVGAAALAMLVGALVIGVRKAGRIHWAPASAITFFAVSCLTDNLSVNAFLIAPLIAWLAIACPRSAPVAVFRSSRAIRYAAVPLLTIIACASVAMLFAAWRYDDAAAAARRGLSPEVIASLRQAVTADPSFALYHRDLGVWLLAAGDIERAERELAIAVGLNPSDLQARRSAALAHGAAGSRDASINAAVAATRINATQVENALTLALVQQTLGNTDAEFSALVEAVRIAPWITAAPEWQHVFPAADLSRIVEAASESWEIDATKSYRNAQARAWLAGLAAGDDPADADLGILAQKHILACDRAGADAVLARVRPDDRTRLTAVVARLMYARAFGGETDDDRALLRMRDPGLGAIADGVARGSAPSWDYSHDTRYYDRLPVIPPHGLSLPTQASGISAWLRDPIEAAKVGAPDSPLAQCR